MPPEPPNRNRWTRIPIAILLSVAITVALAPADARAQTTGRDFEDDSWVDGLVDLRGSDRANTGTTGSGLSNSGLEVTIPAGSLRGLGAIDRLPVGADEAWYRYHIQLVRFDPRSSGKLPGLSGLYSSSARGCQRSRPGSPGWSARGLFGAEGTYGAPDGEVPIGFYVYHLDQPGSCGEALFWEDASLKAGKWHCIEGHVRLNTPGLRDGQLTGWLDGNQRFSRSGLAFRRPDETAVGIRELWLNIYYGGKRPTRNTLNLVIDEVEVSTDGRLGCLEVATDLVGKLGGGSDSVATYQPGTGDWILNQWDGSRFAETAIARYSTPTRWAAHLVGDFGGDGTDDIASFHPDNGSWWVSRSGKTGFETSLWSTFSSRSGWSAHVPGDFVGDGSTQIASYNNTNGTWWVSAPTYSIPPSVSESPGDGMSPGQAIVNSIGTNADAIIADLELEPMQQFDSFTIGQWDSFTTQTGWTEHLPGDFNGDGKDDIANYHSATGTWWVSESMGSGFRTRQWGRFGTPHGWSIQSTGDFNGDHLDDIASFYPGTGTWWVSTSTGDGFTTRPWSTFSTPTGWGNHLVGDFNGDGLADVANYHRLSGTWWVSVSDGESFTTGQWDRFSTYDGWETQVAGDFNGDQLDDIASYHRTSGTWWVSTSTGSKFNAEKWSGP